MSEETPRVDPKYYKSSGRLPQLAPPAQKAFSGLLLVGLAIILVAIIIMLVVSWVAGLSIFSLGIPFIVGAGIVAGLGKRESE